MIYTGLALEGLVGFGLLPLCVEYGIQIIAEAREQHEIQLATEMIRVKRRNVNATIGGIVTNATNILGVVIIYFTTPGNIPGLNNQDIPFVWLAIMMVGGVFFLSLPRTRLRKEEELEHMHDDDGLIDESALLDGLNTRLLLDS